MSKNFEPVVDERELFEEEVYDIAISSYGHDEQTLYEDVQEYLDNVPRAAQNILEYSSIESLDSALERGDGLSQRVIDLVREMLTEEVRALHEDENFIFDRGVAAAHAAHGSHTFSVADGKGE